MILVWGMRDDPPTAALCEALRSRREPLFFLDQSAAMETSLQTRGNSVHLRCGAQECRLDQATAAFIRPYGPDQIVVNDGTKGVRDRMAHAQRINEWMWAWADTTAALVLNRPTAMEANHSKPWQLAQLKSAGFAVPETLITNTPAAARQFWRQQREVICKSMSSQRSVVRRLGPDDAARLDDIENCPVQFQRWIDGVDVRVHVIGKRVVACEIRAVEDDYRYAVEGRQISSCVLPEVCAQRCVQFARAAGLGFAGIDLRRTDTGEWVCFEANPSPAFMYFGGEHARAVAAALADELCAWEKGTSF